MTRRLLGVFAAAVLVAGCIDRTRVNQTCVWSDSVSRSLDLTRAGDREHLRQDAEIANELMVRVGDAHAPHRPDIQAPFRDACISALMDTITARHGVTRAQIRAAERNRVWWADVLVVFLPMALLGALVMDYVVRRVCRTFDSDDRGIATVSVVLLVPVVALVTLGVANFWSFMMEGWRLGDGHVSNRAFLIPIVTHGWISYFSSLAVCAGIAARRFRRTPLTGGMNGLMAARIR